MLQFHIVKALLPDMDGFPSGQRGQTVNLLQFASVVRIHLHPFARRGLRVAMRPLVCGPPYADYRLYVAAVRCINVRAVPVD